MAKNPRPPSLLSLRAFEAAARHLSFTQAARELHVTQAAISRHVRTLESELGKPLFRRLHRSVELTSSGQRFAGALTVGFRHIQQAVDNVRNASRPLRVSVEPAFASRWLLPRLRSFSLAHPEIELQLDSSELIRSLGADTDIAIRFLAGSPRRRIPAAHRLLEIECIPVFCGGAREDLQLTRDTDVLELTLLHEDDGTFWQSWFNAAGLDGFERVKHQYLSDYALTLEAAQQGNGVALGVTAFIEPEIKAGRLRQIGSTRIYTGCYWMLEARDRAASKLRTLFIRWIRDQLVTMGTTCA